MSVEVLAPDKLSVILFPHPGLRVVARPIKRVDDQLRKVFDRVVELMYEHNGVGLAATQVNIPLRFFAWNPEGKNNPSLTKIFINPVITRPKGNEVSEEGCLSLPNIHADIVRPKTIQVNAYDAQGREVDATFSGFEARILMHETDHLDGVLFLDRLSPEMQKEYIPALDTLATDFKSRQRTGSIPKDEDLNEQMNAWTKRYS